MFEVGQLVKRDVGYAWETCKHMVFEAEQFYQYIGVKGMVLCVDDNKKYKVYWFEEKQVKIESAASIIKF